MAQMEFPVEDGLRVVVDVSKCSKSGAVKVSHYVIFADSTTSETTVTCTCGTGASAKTTTKNCPGTNNTCDCSDPQNPKITCG